MKNSEVGDMFDPIPPANFPFLSAYHAAKGATIHSPSCPRQKPEGHLDLPTLHVS